MKNTNKRLILKSIMKHGQKVRFKNNNLESKYPPFYKSGELSTDVDAGYAYTLDEYLDNYLLSKENGKRVNLKISCTADEVSRFGRLCHLEINEISHSHLLICTATGVTKHTSKSITPFLLGPVTSAFQDHFHLIVEQEVSSQNTHTQEFIDGKSIPGWKAPSCND